jgi:hypothetical protein
MPPEAPVTSTVCPVRSNMLAMMAAIHFIHHRGSEARS